MLLLRAELGDVGVEADGSGTMIEDASPDIPLLIFCVSEISRELQK